MRSVFGSLLGWIARQRRPDLSYRVSHLQGVVNKAKVRDLKETSQDSGQAKEHSNAGLVFHTDAFRWETALVVSVTDASFAQETVIETDGTEKPHRT